MAQANDHIRDSDTSKPARHRVRLPGFLIEEETGLGDVIKKVSQRVGLKPCDGCQKRAAALNQRVRFTPTHREDGRP